MQSQHNRMVNLVPTAFCVIASLVICNAIAQTVKQNQPGAGRLKEINLESVTNLKQDALGFVMYVQDYDERLPPTPTQASLWPLVAPYIKNDKITVHPQTGEKYRVNLSLSGKLLVKIKAPGSMPILFEPQPAPDSTRAIAFLDGHVQRLAETTWRTQRSKSGVTSKMDPNRMPWKLPKDSNK